VHLHDGFYLRMALGAAVLNANFSPKGTGSQFHEVTLTGGGLTFEVAIGGAVADGVILGGRLVGIGYGKPTFKSGDVTDSSIDNCSMSFLQLMADIYPWPKEGYHLQGALGPGGFNVVQPNDYYNADRNLDIGLFTASLGAGWEGWVSSQWALGGLLTLNMAWGNEKYDAAFATPAGRLSTGEARLRVISPTLTFTATYN
jgi:hypothetical protein